MKRYYSLLAILAFCIVLAAMIGDDLPWGP